MTPRHRMDRKQFMATLQPLDADKLRTILWTLYWRGTAGMRERIEEEIQPTSKADRKRREAEAPDGEEVQSDVSRFVALAISGAYIGGTREVTPKQRTKWRFTFRDLVNASLRLLAAKDLEHGVPAVEELVQLAQDCKSYTYFRSEDPVDAMKLVVSDVVEELWCAVLGAQGFRAFIAMAARQLIDWDEEYGWTVTGYSSLCAKERRLADVLSGMLRGTDAWIQAADAYLAALDACIVGSSKDSKGSGSRAREDEGDVERTLKDRTDRMVAWHAHLLERLSDTEADGRLDRIARHRALGGPELDFFRAQLANRRGKVEEARQFVLRCVEKRPGNEGFLEFADKIGAPIPAETRRVWEDKKSRMAEHPVDEDDDTDEGDADDLEDDEE